MDERQIDFEAEGLLDGLEGDARAERLALLEQLAGEGLALSELRRTTASGTIVYLAADRVIAGPERYTAAEVAERSGVDEGFLLDGRRAMGLPIPEPDEPAYTEGELETARLTHIAREAGISDEDLLDLLRVLSRGLSQAAESIRELPLKLVLEPGISESDLARGYAEAAANLYPLSIRSSATCSPCTYATQPRARSSASWSAAAGGCPARARWPSASRTSWASPVSARKSQPTSSVA